MRLVSAEFERFIARHFGAEGRAWLDRLPDRVEHYRREWELEIDCFLPGGLLSCCLAVRVSRAGSAVLKLSGPWAPSEPEAVALHYWEGGPAPALIRADNDGNALLLERILPGNSISLAPSDGEIEQVARLIGLLHSPDVTEPDVRELPKLADVIEQQIATAGAEAAARSSAEAHALRPRLEKTRRTAANILGGWSGEDVLLHGDLEAKNILRCQRRGLVAIDPLPCVGDPAYDAGYWLASAFEPQLREDISVILARHLGLDDERVASWASVAALDC